MKEALNDAKWNLAKAEEYMKQRVDKPRRTKEWRLVIGSSSVHRTCGCLPRIYHQN